MLEHFNISFHILNRTV